MKRSAAIDCPKCGEPGCELRPLATSQYVHCRVCDDGEPPSFRVVRGLNTRPNGYYYYHDLGTIEI